MAGVVASIFNKTVDAEHAIRDLLKAGFTDDRIGVVVHDREIGPGIADDLGREYRAGFDPPENEITSPSDVYQSVPRGFLKSMGAERETMDERRWYTDHLDAHKIMVLVNAGDRSDDAMRILRNHGGMFYTGMAQRPREDMRRDEVMTESERAELRVPVIDEEVVVERMAHQVGEIEIASDTETRTVDIPTTVTHEEIRVERRKLDHPMHPDEYKGSTAQEGVICMPIVEEEIRVTKAPIIREELVVTRVPVTERQTLHETVMHAEPEVRTTGDVEVEGVEEGMMTEEERKRRRRPAA